jgi:hypothetical protein
MLLSLMLEMSDSGATSPALLDVVAAVVAPALGATAPVEAPMLEATVVSGFAFLLLQPRASPGMSATAVNNIADLVVVATRMCVLLVDRFRRRA